MSIELLYDIFERLALLAKFGSGVVGLLEKVAWFSRVEAKFSLIPMAGA